MDYNDIKRTLAGSDPNDEKEEAVSNPQSCQLGFFFWIDSLSGRVGGSEEGLGLRTVNSWWGNIADLPHCHSRHDTLKLMWTLSDVEVLEKVSNMDECGMFNANVHCRTWESALSLPWVGAHRVLSRGTLLTDIKTNQPSSLPSPNQMNEHKATWFWIGLEEKQNH